MPASGRSCLLLGAVVAIYVYNFRALPIEGDGFLAERMKDMAIVLNLGLGAFVTTSVAVRFVFPMVSLEGRSLWVLRTAPVSLERIWWTKFWMGFVPLAAFAVALVMTTNRLLDVPTLPAAIIAGLLVALVAAIVAMGLGVRRAPSEARHRETRRRSRPGSGPWSTWRPHSGSTFVVVAFAAWPIGRLLWAARYDLPISTTATRRDGRLPDAGAARDGDRGRRGPPSRRRRAIAFGLTESGGTVRVSSRARVGRTVPIRRRPRIVPVGSSGLRVSPRKKSHIPH
jgi:hypothetical protein